MRLGLQPETKLGLEGHSRVPTQFLPHGPSPGWGCSKCWGGPPQPHSL